MKTDNEILTIQNDEGKTKLISEFPESIPPEAVKQAFLVECERVGLHPSLYYVDPNDLRKWSPSFLHVGQISYPSSKNNTVYVVGSDNSDGDTITAARHSIQYLQRQRDSDSKFLVALHEYIEKHFEYTYNEMTYPRDDNRTERKAMEAAWIKVEEAYKEEKCQN